MADWRSRGLTPVCVVIALLAAVAGCRGPTDEASTSIEAGIAEPTPESSQMGGDIAPSEESPGPLRPIADADFDTDLDMAALSQMVVHISTEIGEREAGSEALAETARYIDQQLRSLGYEPEVTDYELPDGRTSHNVIAATPATGPRLVLATHMDTVTGCPCANDDATGIASVIEIAGVLKERELETGIPVQFAFLGAEEEIEGHEGHGYSAVRLFEQLAAEEIDRMAAAVWLDKLGRGEEFLALVIEGTSDEAANLYLAAIADGDPKPEIKVVKRWSEEMAFEDHGIPTVWVEWFKDGHLHKPTDTYHTVNWELVAQAADGTLKLVLSKSWMTED